MKNQPNKATVKDGVPTAEKSFNDFAKSMGYQTWSDMRNAFCMDGFALNDRIFKAAEAHTATLLERVKELEAQNKRLKIAHYTIVRAYEEYGPLASVSTKQVSENVLKEIGFDPSKETL